MDPSINFYAVYRGAVIEILEDVDGQPIPTTLAQVWDQETANLIVNALNSMTDEQIRSFRAQHCPTE